MALPAPESDSTTTRGPAGDVHGRCDVPLIPQQDGTSRAPGHSLRAPSRVSLRLASGRDRFLSGGIAFPRRISASPCTGRGRGRSPEFDRSGAPGAPHPPVPIEVDLLFHVEEPPASRRIGCIPFSGRSSWTRNRAAVTIAVVRHPRKSTSVEALLPAGRVPISDGSEPTTPNGGGGTLRNLAVGRQRS
jgi:hypothetical protein